LLKNRSANEPAATVVIEQEEF
jgi:hypothetical protein